MVRYSSSRFIVGLLSILIICLVYISISLYLIKDHILFQNNGAKDQDVTTTKAENHLFEEGYLVSTPSCHIPSLDPFAPDVMKIFQRQKYEKCVPGEDPTRIEMNWNTSDVTLVYNGSAFVNTMCCYREIIRSGQGRNSDTEFKLTSCTDFNETIILPPSVEFIFVECKSAQKTVYENMHAIIRDKPEIRKRLTKFKEKSKNHRPLSVLMLAIDSVSRLNFIRSMPQTYLSLLDNNWFELQGYNKVEDNTFPNLMAILTGFNLSVSFEKCQPENIGKLDSCPFIWDNFRETGYATAYGEDEPSFSTFNSHDKRGFLKPPTDYYMRPYMMAAEKLLIIKHKGVLNFCLGSKEAGVHVYDYAMDFATQFKKDASFGLFWLNSFSHDILSDPSSMDVKVNDYIRIMDERGILNESMVVMFSDHGLRYGNVRLLYTGWLEERLPFIFIWLPPWFRKEHPEFVEALKVNRNRLTNPYDMHMTLKHILKLADPNQEILPAPNCPKCQSLFDEVPWNRTCEDISIESHWCTCQMSRKYDEHETIVQDAVDFALADINRLLDMHDPKHLCARLTLKKISHARKVEYRKPDDSYDDYLVTFFVDPSDAWLESTVRYRENIGFELNGITSRINENGKQGFCQGVYDIRLYCYCNSLLR